jgi:hypothetical protein
MIPPCFLKKKKYCVSWYANLSGISGIGANRVGAYFSKDSVFQYGHWQQIPAIPQIENLAIVTDTLNWLPFHQIFTAEGGERYMTIGNFREAALIDSIVVNPSLRWPYYYFDDFGVYELPEISAGLGGEIDTLGENVNLQANCEGSLFAFFFVHLIMVLICNFSRFIYFGCLAS